MSEKSFWEKASVEDVIIVLLWAGMLLSFSIALMTGYSLYVSDAIGFIGLSAVTIIAYLKRSFLLPSLVILLFFGMLNIASFLYFINLTIAFSSFGTGITPGIQLYSLALFFVLALFRRPILIQWLKETAGISNEKRVGSFDKAVKFYKTKFEKLSEQELVRTSKLDLTEEARQALTEVFNERRRQVGEGSTNLIERKE
jgi:Zn-dependent protease with chaperone function